MKNAFESITESIREELAQALNRCGLMYRMFYRVKTLSSIQHKMAFKGDKYKSGESKMQDIIGFRIVLYFPDDVDLVSLYFSCKDVVKRSVDVPDPSTFRPQRLNLTLNIPEQFVELFKKKLPAEYAPYIDPTYEIQIRTVFSEGWHEVEHDFRYKCKEDWVGYEFYSRTLNCVIATLENAEWSMKALFHEMSHKNYLDGNYRAMLRNKLRIRLKDEDFSPAVSDYLQSHPQMARNFLKIDRMVFVLMLMNHKQTIDLTYDNIIFLVNRIEINDLDFKALEGEEKSKMLDQYLLS